MTDNAVAYLDHNASTPVRDSAADAVVRALAQAGNASSVHRAGRLVRRLIEDARAAVSALAGCSKAQVVFTSGGTEANNLALTGWPAGNLLVSPIEHPSVLSAAAARNPKLLLVDDQGRVDVDGFAELAARAAPGSLVSVMLANNETGVIQPVAKIAEIAHRHGISVHCDAVQAAGKIPVRMDELGVDLMTLSAHKIGGPQGVGALLLRPGTEVTAQILGGGQEKGRRGGTENVPGIAGFGAAALEAVSDLGNAGRVAGLRDRLEEKIHGAAPEAIVIGADAERLPNTSCLAMPGTGSEVQVMALDLAGVLISAGSACSSGKVGPSHVLDAMGIHPDLAGSVIRVSLGYQTTEQEVTRFVDAWTATYQNTAGKNHNHRAVAQ